MSFITPDTTPSESSSVNTNDGKDTPQNITRTPAPYGSVFIALTCLSILSLELQLPVMFVISPIIIFAAIITTKKHTQRITFITVFLLFITSLFQKGNTDAALENPIILEHWIVNIAEYSFIIVLILIVSWLSHQHIHSSHKPHHAPSISPATKYPDTVLIPQNQEVLEELELHRLNELKRLAELGKLSSDIFHDLTNVLTPLTIVLREQCKIPSTSRKDTPLAEEAVKNIERFIGAVRRHIHMNETNELFSPMQAARDALILLTCKATKSNVRLIFKKQGNSKMFGSPIKYQQIILNLVSNSIDACRERENHAGVITVRVRSKRKSTKILIKDNGCGIPPVNIHDVFKTNFSTKKAKYHFGVGLSIVQEIVTKNFNGTIELKSSEGYGTSCTVTLPHATKQELRH